MTDNATRPAKRRGRPRKDAADGDVGTVKALDRGIELLRVLAENGPQPLTELALRVGMPPSSAHRLLGTLESRRVVSFEPATQTWAIGVEAFRIGNAFVQRNNIVEASIGIMRKLVDETGETANLGIADGGHVVFLSQSETSYPVRAFHPPGTRGPIHASGIGKMLLALMARKDVEAILKKHGLTEKTPKTITSPSRIFDDLERIRECGWSLDDEESCIGMRCIAAPVHDSFGTAIAGLSISGPSQRIGDAAIPELALLVKRAAARVTDAIGGQKAPAMGVPTKNYVR